jgi:glycosyltransferase involved in cell wall biosynthesis
VPFAVSVGTVSTRKNHAVAVRAVAKVPDVELVIVGPAGDASASVARLADELGVTHRVHFRGAVSDDQLADLVGRALVLVHPSTDEGFGLPPLEAMTAGTPAIVSRCGSLPEVVGDAAVIVDHDDADGWAAAIDRIRTDDDLRSGLVRRGKARAAVFTWEETARRLRAIHLDVVRPSP